MHVVIHGEVQGVGFRFHARRQAYALGLSGWIRNRPDGSVEAAVQGNSDQVERFLDWSGRGPPSASVDRVDVEEAPPEQASSGFRIEG